MQAEQYAIVCAGFCRIDYGIAEPGECGRGYLATRAGRCAEYMVDLPVVLPADVEKPGQLRILFPAFCDGLGADEEIPVSECLLISLDATEGIFSISWTCVIKTLCHGPGYQ
jgi:hypothetical protein